MIYKDTASNCDNESWPAKRYYVKCINCGKTWDYHDGWACDAGAREKSFSKVPSSKRYLTQVMADSIAPARAAPDSNHGPFAPTKGIRSPTTNPLPAKDMSDWRNWQHKRPGECKCGIPIGRCTYHGGWDLET